MIPCSQLVLAIPSAELIVALRLCLSIPVFSNADPPLCTCGQYVDCFGDHLIGCGCDPFHMQRHDALCNIIYHAFLEDNSEVRREQRISGESATRPGDVFHPDFSMVALLTLTF